MTTQFQEIGCAPYECDCANLGITPDFDELNAIECAAYIVALKRVHGVPPKGVWFTIKRNHHDFGFYREVVVKYDLDNLYDDEVRTAMAYVRAVANGLAHWHDARMSAPVQYKDTSKDVAWRIKDAGQISTLFFENARNTSET